jgi:hypothetical protein
VWQEESFDRVLRMSEIDEKIATFLNNPVRQGVVSSVEKYRWLWAAPAFQPSFARLSR